MKDSNTCRLCLSISELRESHIIPSCIFKLIRDKKLNHRFYQLFNRQNQEIQDGPKEFLLCCNCELKISLYEKYFKEVIHFNKHGTKKIHDEKVFVIENLDYKRIKLFFLSLLWRMSISSKPEFENVCIGDNEEIMRKMIINEDPGNSSKFSVTAVIPLINQRNQEGWSTNAFDLKNQQVTIYSIVIGGILYSVSTACQNSFFPENLLLNESGRWIIPLRDISEIQFLWEFVKHHFSE